MGTRSAVALWLEAVQALQRVCTAQPGAEAEAAYETVKPVLKDVTAKLQGMPAPKAAWKKMIQQEKV